LPDLHVLDVGFDITGTDAIAAVRGIGASFYDLPGQVLVDIVLKGLEPVGSIDCFDLISIRRYRLMVGTIVTDIEFLPVFVFLDRIKRAIRIGEILIVGAPGFVFAVLTRTL